VTILPIRLSLTEVSLVSLVGPDKDKTGTRWTLGPTWYKDHQYDEEIIPFYDDGDRSRELNPNAAPEPVKVWATQMISQTTDYRVTDWSELIPTLEQENHTLEFRHMGGGNASYLVDGTTVRWTIGRLADPNDVIVIPRPERPGTTTYIPVRAIARVNHSIARVPVMNA
jgi:hypothetical protein